MADEPERPERSSYDEVVSLRRAMPLVRARCLGNDEAAMAALDAVFVEISELPEGEHGRALAGLIQCLVRLSSLLAEAASGESTTETILERAEQALRNASLD